MEKSTFLGHYRISVDESGAARELGRAGAAITYDAIDEMSGETVALKLIPVASVDSAAQEQFEEQARAAARIKHVNVAKVFDFRREDDYFVYVSVLLQGEPLTSWVEQHGPMPPDAVLRVAEQIVSVLSTARFHKIARCAIQPSNLMIVPGSTPEGSWPLVKLINFGLAGLKIGTPNGGDEGEVSFSVAPEFASPEELQHEAVDFRSEVYSLGATMCFLLTGSAPSPEMRRRARELSGFPKALRNLIGNMLHHDPDQRPKDPVALTEMIRECLLKIERRQELARKLGVPLAGVIPRKSKTPPAPLAQVLRGIFVFAVIVLAAGVLGAFLLPADINPFRYRTVAKQMVGVPVGVPEASPIASPQATDTAPVVANQPETPSGFEAAASPGANQTSSPSLEEGHASSADFVAAATPAGPPEASSKAPGTAPEDAARAQDTASASPSPGSSGTASRPATASQSTSRSKKKRVASTTKRRESSVRARMVGITSDGKLIYRLPSGRTRVVAPDEGEFVPGGQRRAVIPQPRDESFAPSPPFPPDYYPYD